MYDELTAEDATRLACKHLNRGQKIPQELMQVLETHDIADHFKDSPDEDGTESTD